MEAFREAERMQLMGADIMHLSLGQPGASPPQAVKQALIKAIEEASLGYTDACGIPALRERISAYYKERYGLSISPHRIFVTIGSSSAFLLSLYSAFDAGDRVALARPCYPAYPNILNATNLEPVFLDTDEKTAFQPTAAMLETQKNMRGLIVASPSNPTGTMLHSKEMKEIAEYAKEKNIQLLSDEIYHGVTYGNKARSMLEFEESAIVTNSFSKYFLLPGWRLGWAVVPDYLTRSFESLAQNFFISPPTASQLAALEVFDHLDHLDRVVETYAENRKILKASLERAGIKGLGQSEGAFYLYANVSAFTDDSKSFCQRMLEEIHVCAVPGTDFDEQNGNHYIRFSYCGKTEVIQEATERLDGWLLSRQK